MKEHRLSKTIGQCCVHAGGESQSSTAKHGTMVSAVTQRPVTPSQAVVRFESIRLWPSAWPVTRLVCSIAVFVVLLAAA